MKAVVRRWHRRLGVWSALAVVFLTITGIVLNHIDTLSGESPFITSELLLDWYEVAPPSTVYGYQIEQAGQTGPHSDIIWADGTVIANETAVLYNQESPLGMVRHEDILYLITRDHLHLFTKSGQRIESMPLTTPSSSLFEQALGTDNPGVIVLVSEAEAVSFDLEDMEFAGAVKENAGQGEDLAKTLSSSDLDADYARNFTLLKSSVLLDMHSGRFLGRYGPLLMDFVGLVFLTLAFSGLFIWLKGSNRSKRRIV